ARPKQQPILHKFPHSATLHPESTLPRPPIQLLHQPNPRRVLQPLAARCNFPQQQPIRQLHPSKPRKFPYLRHQFGVQ
ncbi:hypothetical protein LINPERHAP2_LOCUS39621, partial [Linum perenne]